MPAIHQSKTEFRQAIYNDYLAAHPDIHEFQFADVAMWAIMNDRWAPTLKSAVKICAAELADAARVEYSTDPQNRRIRTKHPRREYRIIDGRQKQLVFWEDIRNATPEHMQVSLQQRRQGIVSDCAQLKRDSDSYNENNPTGAHIQMEFDFTQDMLELEAPESYPDQPEDVDDDDDQV
jgi:hypothetical protein